jgi:AcrR family transcriptional regulator
MSREYDSSRRQRQALETRRRILDAAVRLHAQGITEVRPLAEAAGVSLPTVRKHFPSKERIFEGCTAHFLASFTPPDFVAAAADAAPSARVARVVELLAGVHEASHHLIWHAYPAAAESPALAAALAGQAGLVEQAVDALAAPGDCRNAAASRRRARLRGLLDTLTYRALRVHAGLDARATREELTALVRAALAPPSEHPSGTAPTTSATPDTP